MFPVVQKLYKYSWYTDSPQYCSVVAGTLFVAGDHFLQQCPQTWQCPHASAIPFVPTDCCLHWIFVLIPQTVPPSNTSTCLKTVWLINWSVYSNIIFDVLKNRQDFKWIKTNISNLHFPHFHSIKSTFQCKGNNEKETKHLTINP